MVVWGFLYQQLNQPLPLSSVEPGSCGQGSAVHSQTLARFLCRLPCALTQGLFPHWIIMAAHICWVTAICCVWSCTQIFHTLSQAVLILPRESVCSCLRGGNVPSIHWSAPLLLLFLRAVHLVTFYHTALCYAFIAVMTKTILFLSQLLVLLFSDINFPNAETLCWSPRLPQHTEGGLVYTRCSQTCDQGVMMSATRGTKKRPSNLELTHRWSCWCSNPLHLSNRWPWCWDSSVVVVSSTWLLSPGWSGPGYLLWWHVT